MHNREEKLTALGRLLDVQERLRKECPWDRKQTRESLRSNTIEEVYELTDALMSGSESDVREELGDVMEHVVLYSLMAEEHGDFDIADVFNHEADKLIFRHPFIYGDVKGVDSIDKVEQSWEQTKQKEHEKEPDRGVLGGVPKALPSVIKAYRMQDKARNVGFDWAQPVDVWDKVYEEIGELKAELECGDTEKSTEELGDFLFAVINAARLYHLNPDDALEKSNVKFKRRFEFIERKAKEQGKRITDMSMREMDAAWDEAKRQGL